MNTWFHRYGISKNIALGFAAKGVDLIWFFDNPSSKCGFFRRQTNGCGIKSDTRKSIPRELAAILANLDRLLEILKEAPNSRAVQAGFIHSEGGDILAVDQKGGGPHLMQTRGYLFCEDIEKTVHLITIGDKRTQSRDVQYSKEFLRIFKLKDTNEQSES